MIKLKPINYEKFTHRGVIFVDKSNYDKTKTVGWN